MTDIDTVDERLRAVERAISADGAADVELTDPTGELGERIEALEAEVADLDAAVQAIRGYVGHVRSVDESVANEADSALAAVDDLRKRVNRLEEGDDRFSPDPNERTVGSADGERDDYTGVQGRVDRESTPPTEHASADGGIVAPRHDARTPASQAPRRVPVCPCCRHRERHPSAPQRRDRDHCETGPSRGSRADSDRTPDEQETEDAPVEDVDEDGLVDRLRGSL